MLLTISLRECLNRIPSNARPAEADAVATLKPLVENMSWDDDGNVYGIDSLMDIAPCDLPTLSTRAARGRI
jgi:hypothetical protein